MEIRLGNDLAIEGYRDPDSDDPDLVRYKPQEGQHTTTLVLPDDLSTTEGFATVVATARLHMERDAYPVWVEGDSESLVSLLKEHWGIEKERPRNWGTGKTVRDREAFIAERDKGDEEE